MHITNKHMDLDHVASTIARTFNGVGAVLVADEPPVGGFDALASNVMFPVAVRISDRRDKHVGRRDSGAGRRRPRNRGEVPWTDDYSNVPGAIMRKKGWN